MAIKNLILLVLLVVVPCGVAVADQQEDLLTKKLIETSRQFQQESNAATKQALKSVLKELATLAESYVSNVTSTGGTAPSSLSDAIHQAKVLSI